MSIGKRILSLRKIAHITQGELAELMGISKSAMNRVELGARPLRDDEVAKLADIFNVSADLLLGRITGYAPKQHSKSMVELKKFLEVAKQSTPANIKIATGLLEELNSHFGKKDIKKEPSNTEG